MNYCCPIRSAVGYTRTRHLYCNTSMGPNTSHKEFAQCRSPHTKASRCMIRRHPVWMQPTAVVHKGDRSQHSQLHRPYHGCGPRRPPTINLMNSPPQAKTHFLRAAVRWTWPQLCWPQDDLLVPAVLLPLRERLGLASCTVASLALLAGESGGPE